MVAKVVCEMDEMDGLCGGRMNVERIRGWELKMLKRGIIGDRCGALCRSSSRVCDSFG
jgi:hypothetical protein